MLSIMIPLLTLLIAPWVTPSKWLWKITTSMSFMIAIMSISWFYAENSLPIMNQYLLIDGISSPLLVLTCWLTTPTLLASQSKLSNEPISRQRVFIFSIASLQTMTLLAFMASDLMLFFILFESTMIPTLIIITRWGAQKERMLAGVYFLFYTLFGSMALLTAILFFYETFGTLSVSLLKTTILQPKMTPHMTAWWIACLLAFLIKMPLYGVHLWLPKAHVEAPIAGSMILAGTLLKLGGYGIMRINIIISDSFSLITTPIITVALFGVFLSAILCSRQTDLKSLIAYSSVSHMGLVIAASMVNTEWSMTGAIILMISHGLISSALFCLANTSYERTNTRTLTLLQGSQIIHPLMAAWWLLASLLNMALPPSINFVGELFILTALFQWTSFTIILTGLGMAFTTVYSLYLFWSTQREYPPLHMKTLPPIQSREHILMALHIIPTLLLMFSPNLLF